MKAPERSIPTVTSRVARNGIYNLVGQIVPMGAGLLTIPLLLRTIGTERFGVLSMAWLVVGYSGLFDLGFSRSLTQITAEMKGGEKSLEVPALFWTAIITSALLSLLVTLLLFSTSGWVIGTIFKVSPDLHKEVVEALRVLALSIPAAILTPVIIGFLSAYEEFRLINTIKIPTGILITVSPAVMLLFSSSLVPIMGALVGSRVIGLIWFLLATFKKVPQLRSFFSFKTKLFRRLISYGAWVTVSNVVSPILVYCDRFVIGATLAASSVAYYSTPLDVVTKLLIIPVAIVTALFPVIAQDFLILPEHCNQLVGDTIRKIFILLFPFTLFLETFGRRLFSLWLGPAFADQSFQVLALLSFGILLNGLAQVPASTLQAIGRPHIAARFHLFELIIYIPILFFSVKHFGIVGAAAAWVCRVAVDGILLYGQIYLDFNRHAALKRVDLLKMFALLAALVGTMIVQDWNLKILWGFISGLVFLLLYGRLLARNLRFWRV